MSDDFIITPVTVPTVTVKLDDPNATISTVEGDGAVFFEASAPTPTEPSDDTLAYVGVPVTSFTMEPVMPTGRQERAVVEALSYGDVCGTRTKFSGDCDGIRCACGTVVVRRLAARINDLRNKGWNIETVKWCDQHPHPESKQIMYRLVSPANHTVTYPTGPIDPEDVFI